MKRLQYLAALVVLSVVLTACNREAASPSEQPSAAVPGPGQTASGTASFTATDSVMAGAARTACSIDKINDKLAAGAKLDVQQGSDVRFVGWISDSARNVPASFRIVLSGKSTYAVEASAGISRPDVVRALKAEGLAQAGFEVIGNLGEVPAGEYAVVLAVDGAGGREVCPTRTRVAVAAAPG